VAKQDLGTKRLCPNCGAKYYDLNKNPPVCPKCDTVFVLPTPKTRQPEPPPPPPAEEEKPEKKTDPADKTISLEEADKEQMGQKASGPDDDEDEDGDLEVESDDDDDDDTFLEEDEDEGDDVTDIIGDVDKEDD
jgi:uncharacterized protein (TIGR02300 family)